MAEHFEEENFEFTPPEFDISLIEENPNEEIVFTAPSVENTLEENVSFEAPSFKEEMNDINSAEVISEVEETETPSFENVDIAPVVEDIKEENVSEAVPQFENPDMAEFEMPSDFIVPETEEIKEILTEEIEETSTEEFKETSTEEIEETTNETPSFEMPNEEIIPTNIEAQEKVASAIREKISEIQDAKTEDNSPNITESKEEVPTFEAVVAEETQISSPSETYQAEPVSKEDMFVDGRKKLKNMITNESQQTINAIKDNALTK